MTEAQIQFEILKAWGAHPRLRIARINTGAAMVKGRLIRFNPPGTADIVGLIAPSGRMVMVECKSATGKQRKEQETMQRVVTAMGGLYILARSLADVDAAFQAIGLTRFPIPCDS